MEYAVIGFRLNCGVGRIHYRSREKKTEPDRYTFSDQPEHRHEAGRDVWTLSLSRELFFA